MALMGPGFTRFSITFRQIPRADISLNMHWHNNLQVALTGFLSVPRQTRVPSNRKFSARSEIFDTGDCVSFCPVVPYPN